MTIIGTFSKVEGDKLRNVLGVSTCIWMTVMDVWVGILMDLCSRSVWCVREMWKN